VGGLGMIASDEFSQYYAELLQGTYDCVDRIVLNAFYPLGPTRGGVRSWWRRLYGDDSNLDDEHLREMAGTFSRRLHAFCAEKPSHVYASSASGGSTIPACALRSPTWTASAAALPISILSSSLN
jgi:hypothetical protein